MKCTLGNEEPQAYEIRGRSSRCAHGKVELLRTVFNSRPNPEPGPLQVRRTSVVWSCYISHRPCPAPRTIVQLYWRDASSSTRLSEWGIFIPRGSGACLNGPETTSRSAVGSGTRPDLPQQTPVNKVRHIYKFPMLLPIAADVPKLNVELTG